MEERESKVQKVKRYILRNKVLVAVTTCLVACLLLSSGVSLITLSGSYVMKQKLQEQNTALGDLQKNYDTLVSKYNTLQSDYDNLESEITNYQDQQSTIDDLNAQLVDLQAKYDTLSAENEELKQQIAEEDSSSGGGAGGSGGGTLFIPNSSNGGNDSSGGMVWLSATGSKYHSIPDCGNMNPNNARQVSRSSAEAQGYDACSKCW